MASSGTAIFAFNDDLVVDASMGADVTSDSYEVKEQKTLAFQAVWSGGGSPNGLMELQGSLDNVNFTRIQGSVLAATGNSGTNGWNIENPGYPWIRFVYTRTSGTATLNVKISGKYL